MKDLMTKNINLCPLLIEMVNNNNLGIKTGQGFYDYSEGPRNKKVASQFQK